MLSGGSSLTRRVMALIGGAGLLSGALSAMIFAAGRPAAAQGPGGLERAAELPELRAINATGAWRLSTGKGVVVGVLDSGVDPTVPDLTGSVTTGPDLTAGANPAGYQPPRLHGTYIASLIAGHGSGPGRADGIIGVAPAAKVLSIRVILEDTEPGYLVYNENASYDDAIANGIRYAVGHGASVINMSLGTGDQTRSLRQAVTYAISHNVVVVAAAGNERAPGSGFTSYTYPASFTGVISVAAVNASGAAASFSDRNSSVVISAPGVGVVGAGPPGSVLIVDGTSPASAFVAGVAALIRSRYPSLPAALVAQAIIGSTSRRPSGGYSPSVGFGEVDATAALAAAARLAGQRADTGLAVNAHLGGAVPGPVVVIRRDYAEIAVLAGIAVVGLLGFGVSVTALATGTRRAKNRARDGARDGARDRDGNGAAVSPAWPVADPVAEGTAPEVSGPGAREDSGPAGTITGDKAEYEIGDCVGIDDE